MGAKTKELLAGLTSSCTDAEGHAGALISHHSRGHGRAGQRNAASKGSQL